MTQDERPSFATLQSALRWAYYGALFDGNTVKPSAIAGFLGRDHREQLDNKNRVRRGPPAVPLARRPKRFDAAAQAGMLKGFLSRLPSIERNHLMAKYLVGRERSRARARLVRPVLRRIGLDWITIRLTTALVAEYYGKPTEDQALLEEHNLGRHHLEVARRKIQITLDAVSRKAEDSAYDHFHKDRVLA